MSSSESTASPGLDRAVGALLGLAAGDAVGTTLEFKPPGSFAPIHDMVGGGPFGLAPGEWTDDTSMALCLAQSLLDTGRMDLADQLRRYLLWRDKGYLSSNGRCFDIGTTTNRQLERFRRSGEPVDPAPDEQAAANGSLMRLASVPIRWHRELGDAEAHAAMSSRTTHPAARPVDACRVVGTMVAALIAGEEWDEVVAGDRWRQSGLHPEVAAVAAGSWATRQPPAIQGSGYCVAALEAALWAVGGAHSYEDAVLRAANLGDDADTTAAIAGQLAGARWGAAAIPLAWRGRVVGAERIESLARHLYRAGGGLVEVEWPAGSALRAEWVEPFTVLAGEHPGERDPSLIRDRLELLVDAGVRTLVELSAPAADVEPYDAALGQIAADRRLDLCRVALPWPDAAADGVGAAINAATSRGAVYVHGSATSGLAPSTLRDIIRPRRAH